MIYDAIGTPLGIALANAGLALAERIKTRGPYGREFRRPRYLMDGKNRAAKVGRDKNGDVFPIYRELHVHKPGRGYASRQDYKAWVDAPKTYPGPVQPPALAAQ